MQEDVSNPSGLERVFLLPGEYHITKQPKFLVTLLGSCVAVCLANTVNGSAAMNHYMREANPNPNTDVGKFGDTSIKYIIESLFALDPNPSNYRAKIFGGGAVVGHLGLGVGIGQANVIKAKEVLAEYGIRIVEEHVGGTQGRKIYFDSSTFDVQVKMIGEEKKDFTKKNIQVLVVDDSPLVRQILRKVIEATPGLEVCAEAGDAFEARKLMLELDPDVISLDIIMPKLDGLKFLEKIMQYKPMPVVIVSTIAKDKSPIRDKAIKLGAVAVIDKDSLEIYKGIETAKQDYIPALRTAANTNVKRLIT